MANIFISYNHKVETEQSLALRLQTLGSLYGLSISLPDRIGSVGLKDTTMQRIEKSSLFIVFSTRNLTKFVVNEINYAITLKKKIIIVYDKDVEKKSNLQGVHEIEYNHRTDNPEKIISEILSIIHKSPSKSLKSTSASEKEENTMGAFILVGLGLLLLAAVTSKGK